tara:strand:- start:2223 stop:3011 length:789 start_codon:yes stop_codon:yes gene_type:complete
MSSHGKEPLVEESVPTNDVEPIIIRSVNDVSLSSRARDSEQSSYTDLWACDRVGDSMIVNAITTDVLGRYGMVCRIGRKHSIQEEYCYEGGYGMLSRLVLEDNFFDVADAEEKKIIEIDLYVDKKSTWRSVYFISSPYGWKFVGYKHCKEDTTRTTMFHYATPRIEVTNFNRTVNLCLEVPSLYSIESFVQHHDTPIEELDETIMMFSNRRNILFPIENTIIDNMVYLAPGTYGFPYGDADEDLKALGEAHIREGFGVSRMM